MADITREELAKELAVEITNTTLPERITIAKKFITKAQKQLLDELIRSADSEGRLWVGTIEAKRKEIKE